ncbi:MAG TPA: DUF1343 domain-containing protein [Cyclobacteriaceae bacterium]|nr:DUF1343 domain-containing protein [Cyclobacteriaceae bacterium]
MKRIFSVAILLCLVSIAAINTYAQVKPRLLVGANQMHIYLPQFKDKRVAVFANNTAVLGNVHLVDILASMKVNVVKILSPEHGFRGDVPDGDNVGDSIDEKTGIPIVSIYGDKNKKPTPAHLSNVDIVVFDIQDVGTRFYTYISSLHYLMEACAENNKKLFVLDRPNPNGFVDGPILEAENKSFVGMHPIPIAHGLTIGELAYMINGEGWLEGGKKCDLQVIAMTNYTHHDSISLPVKPSPNLPNDHAIAMYPSICLFEGTALSLGRGTQNPFELIGHPSLKNQPFEFTPVSIPTMSAKPKLENEVCHGVDLRKVKPERKISLKYLIDMYKQFPDKEKFFIPYIDKLSGTKEFKEQIKKGMTEEEIRATWEPGLAKYREMRKKYTMYPD